VTGTKLKPLGDGTRAEKRKKKIYRKSIETEGERAIPPAEAQGQKSEVWEKKKKMKKAEKKKEVDARIGSTLLRRLMLRKNNSFHAKSGTGVRRIGIYGTVVAPGIGWWQMGGTRIMKSVGQRVLADC